MGEEADRFQALGTLLADAQQRALRIHPAPPRGTLERNRLPVQEATRRSHVEVLPRQVIEQAVKAVRWAVTLNLLIAWLLTIPASGLIAAVCWRFGRNFLSGTQ